MTEPKARLGSHQLIDVAPFAGHAAVAEQPPHGIGGGHQLAHTVTPAVAAAGAARCLEAQAQPDG